MKEYYVLVGNRVFQTFIDKAKAEEIAKIASGFYTQDCSVTHKNYNRVSGIPVYRNGKAVADGYSA